jgi:AraC family transcriptional regulator
MTQSSAYGSSFGDRFHLENAPAFVIRTSRRVEIAVTEIRSDNPKPAMSESIPQEDAFLVHEYWEDGRQAPVTSLRAGDTTIYDLKRDPTFYMNNAFHSVISEIGTSEVTAKVHRANMMRKMQARSPTSSEWPESSEGRARASRTAAARTKGA